MNCAEFSSTYRSGRLLLALVKDHQKELNLQILNSVRPWYLAKINHLMVQEDCIVTEWSFT